MQSPDLSDTQPRRVKTDSPANASPPEKPLPNARSFPWRWLLLWIAISVIAVIAGTLSGFKSAQQITIQRQVTQLSLALEQQYQLGLQDLAAGRYDVAIQRFQYILSQDPSYPGVAAKITEAGHIFYATSTQTPLPPTATATSTPDLRPIQDLFQSAYELVVAQDWDAALETLISLRKADRNYMTTRVDGLMFISLRQRGVKKIRSEHNLQGGTYDLALAEHFGPIDAEANNLRNLARLYLYGAGFWEVDWGKAAEYFGQVAAVAPGLSDSSGMTAAQRYHIALMNYGDQLVNQNDWCSAQYQYQLAQNYGSDSTTQEKLNSVTLRCQGVSPTSAGFGASPTATSTSKGPITSPAPTDTEVNIPTPSATQAVNTPIPTTPAFTNTPANTQELPPTAPSDQTPYPAPPSGSTTGIDPPRTTHLGLFSALLIGFLIYVAQIIIILKKLWM